MAKKDTILRTDVFSLLLGGDSDYSFYTKKDTEGHVICSKGNFLDGKKGNLVTETTAKKISRLFNVNSYWLLDHSHPIKPTIEAYQSAELSEGADPQIAHSKEEAQNFARTRKGKSQSPRDPIPESDLENVTHSLIVDKDEYQVLKTVWTHAHILPDPQRLSRLGSVLIKEWYGYHITKTRQTKVNI